MSGIQGVLKTIDLLCRQNEELQQQLESLKEQVRSLQFIEEQAAYQLAEKRISKEMLRLLKAATVNKKYGVSIDQHTFEHASLTKEVEYFEDELGDISSQFPPRTDAYEQTYFNQLMDYVNAILNKEQVSKYQLGSPKEAGVSTMSVEKINRTLKRKEEARLFKEKPYVGRIDFYQVEEEQAESLYIGDKSFSDDDENLLVAKWSHDHAALFYDRDIGTVRDYKGLGKIKLDYTRQIDTQNGQLMKLYPAIQVGDGKEDTALNEALTRQSSNMDLITATIGRSQYALITSPFNETLIVQGSAGSGKSIIALYRLSYLLDKSKEGKLQVKFFENSIAFFGPNALFLKHIQSTLKGLGNEAIVKSTLHDYIVAYLNEQLKGSEVLVLRAANSPERAYKGSLQFKELLEQQMWLYINDLRPFTEDFQLTFGHQTYTVHGASIALAYEQSLKLSYSDRKSHMKSYIEGTLTKMLKQEEALSQAIQQKFSSFIADAVQTMELSPFQLTNATEILLHETAQLVKKENKKDGVHVYPIAKSKAAQEAQKAVNKAMNKELQHYLNKHYRVIRQDILQRYNVWLKSSFTEELAAYVETAYQQELQAFLSERVRNQQEGPLYSLKTLVQQFAEEEEAELEGQFMATQDLVAQAFYKLLVDETKPHLFTAFYEAFETAVNQRMRREVESEYKATLQFDKVYKRSTVSAKGLSDAQKYEQLFVQVNSFLAYKFTERPVALYKKILAKAAVNIAQGRRSRDTRSVDGAAEVAQEDVIGIFQVYVMMQGTAYTKPLHYAVIDEAQDLYPFDIWAARQLCKGNGIILFGDLGQNINPINQFDSWEIFAPLLGDVKYYNLEANYRSTKQIVAYCNAIIEPYANGKYALPDKTFRPGEEVLFMPYSNNSLADFLTSEAQLHSFEKVAIICKDEVELVEVKQQVPSFAVIEDELRDEDSLIIATVAQVKGLQFDCVIIPNEAVYSADDFERKLHYVAATRALHQLIVFR